MWAVFEAKFGSAVLLAALLFALPASADQSLDFYERNAARTIFGREAGIKVPGQPAEQHSEPAALEQLTSAAQAVADEGSSDLKHALLVKYGDPKAEQPINVVDNAPKPFKAMMEALDGGEDELAMLYARQYVRYLQKLQRLSGRVVSMTGQVMKGEGLAEGTEWEDAPAFVEDQELMKKILAEEVETVDARGAELLKKAERIERAKAEGRLSPGDEIRLADANPDEFAHVPVDPKGEVNVYLFVDPLLAPPLERVRTVERIARHFGGDSRIAVTIATSSRTSPIDLAALRKQLGTKLRVVDGSSVAGKLGVSAGKPVIVMLSPNTRKAVFEESRWDVDFILRIVESMQGRGV